MPNGALWGMTLKRWQWPNSNNVLPSNKWGPTGRETKGNSRLKSQLHNYTVEVEKKDPQLEAWGQRVKTRIPGSIMLVLLTGAPGSIEDLFQSVEHGY